MSELLFNFLGGLGLILIITEFVDGGHYDNGKTMWIGIVLLALVIYFYPV